MVPDSRKIASDSRKMVPDNCAKLPDSCPKPSGTGRNSRTAVPDRRATARNRRTVVPHPRTTVRNGDRVSRRLPDAGSTTLRPLTRTPGATGVLASVDRREERGLSTCAPTGLWDKRGAAMDLTTRATLIQIARWSDLAQGSLDLVDLALARTPVPPGNCPLGAAVAMV